MIYHKQYKNIKLSQHFGNKHRKPHARYLLTFKKDDET